MYVCWAFQETVKFSKMVAFHSSYTYLSALGKSVLIILAILIGVWRYLIVVLHFSSGQLVLSIIVTCFILSSVHLFWWMFKYFAVFYWVICFLISTLVSNIKLSTRVGQKDCSLQLSFLRASVTSLCSVQLIISKNMHFSIVIKFCLAFPTSEHWSSKWARVVKLIH